MKLKVMKGLMASLPVEKERSVGKKRRERRPPGAPMGPSKESRVRLNSLRT